MINKAAPQRTPGGILVLCSQTPLVISAPSRPWVLFQGPRADARVLLVSCRLHRSARNTTPSGKTWWPCVSMTSWPRELSPSSSWTTLPAANSTWKWLRESLQEQLMLAGKLDVLFWVGTLFSGDMENLLQGFLVGFNEVGFLLCEGFWEE